MTFPPAVELHSVGKKFGATTALDAVELVIEPGECVGFLGPNGAGKSTLLGVLCGIIRPSHGEARVCGQIPGVLTEPGATLGFVLAPAGVSDDLSVREHLRTEVLAQGLPADSVREAIREFGLDGYAKRKIRRLSTGQRQRTALAGVLVGDPAVLVLDEPINGLDIEAVQWLRQIILGRTARGLTTLVSSHNITELRRIATRMVVMRTTVLYDGPLPEGSDDEVEQWYTSFVGVPRESEKAVR